MILFNLYILSTAEEEKEKIISYGVEVDATSRYVDQGVISSKGFAVLPSLWISAFDFTLTSWSSALMSKREDSGRGISETDIILDYEHKFTNLTIKPSVNLLYYPEEESDKYTFRVYFDLAYKIKPLTITTIQSIDIATSAGAYFSEYGLRYTYEHSDKFSLESYIGIGIGSPKYNETNYEIDPEWTLSMAKAKISATWYPKSYFYITPHIDFNYTINKDLQNKIDESSLEKALLYGGLIMGLEF